VTCPLLIEPGAALVLAAGHEIEVIRIDAGGEAASVIRLMPERYRPAVADLPGYVVAAADLLPDAHDRIAVLIDGALPAPAAGRRFDAVADEYLSEGHFFCEEIMPESTRRVAHFLRIGWCISIHRLRRPENCEYFIGSHLFSLGA
jgi:hypothetical protein